MASVKRWSNERLDLYLIENAPGYIRVGNILNNKTKFEMLCPKEHNFTTSVDHFVNKDRRCKECTIMDTRLDEEEVKERFKEAGYKQLTPYVNYKTKVDLMCPNGSIWSIRPKGFFFAGNRCPCSLCKKDKVFVVNKRGPQDLEERGFKVLSEWVNVKTPVEVECTQCLFRRNVTPSSILKGAGCPNCKGLVRLTTATFIEKVRAIDPSYQVLSEVNSSRKPVQMRCGEGHAIFSTEPRDFIYKGRRCPVCSFEKVRRICSGPGAPNYDASIPQKDRDRGRKISGLPYWTRKVKERDKFTCQNHRCSRKCKKIVAHHIESWNHARHLRTVLSNGITLCEECHRNFHRKYGAGDNTRYQLSEWLKNKEGR